LNPFYTHILRKVVHESDRAEIKSKQKYAVVIQRSLEICHLFDQAIVDTSGTIRDPTTAKKEQIAIVIFHQGSLL
jgi:hypothetical protein